MAFLGNEHSLNGFSVGSPGVKLQGPPILIHPFIQMLSGLLTLIVQLDLHEQAFTQ